MAGVLHVHYRNYYNLLVLFHPATLKRGFGGGFIGLIHLSITALPNTEANWYRGISIANTINYLRRGWLVWQDQPGN